MASEKKAEPEADEIEIEESAEQDEGKQQRERSSIQFPYQDLDEAVAIAKGVHEFGGTACQIDQLAAQVKQSPASSMFKLRVSTARVFGFITNAHGNVTLTPLGVRVCDPQQEQVAKAEAFLNVPLYRQVYEQFKGASLPPANGLETTMASMGVAAKQKSNARQVFQRSATQAGFFAFGPNRLVYPPVKGATPAMGTDTSSNEAEAEKKKNGGGSDDGGSGAQHPFIQGLIKTLPQPEKQWPIEKRAQWLQAAVSVFNLIYTDESDGQIEVKVQKAPQ